MGCPVTIGTDNIPVRLTLRLDMDISPSSTSFISVQPMNPTSSHRQHHIDDTYIYMFIASVVITLHTCQHSTAMLLYHYSLPA
jgi:hypothetical protein